MISVGRVFDLFVPSANALSACVAAASAFLEGGGTPHADDIEPHATRHGFDGYETSARQRIRSEDAG